MVDSSRQPCVSVVMATYNYGRYIGQAIRSVVDQTYIDWELVIVDDGSTDNTTEVVQAFLSDPRIQYLQQENQGQPKAKNRGVLAARGEFLAFLDADDMWASEKLSKQLPLFEHDARIGVTYTGLRLINEDGVIVQTCPSPRLRGNVFRQSLYQTIPPFSSSMVRRAVFENVGLFNETIPLAIDYELWLRVAMKWHFDYVDEPLLLYRTGHANLSRRYQERRDLVIHKILPHVFYDCGGAALLSRREVAEGYARLFAGMGENDMSISLASSLYWYLRSAAAAPWLWAGWRGVFRSCVPHHVANAIKRFVMGRNGVSSETATR